MASPNFFAPPSPLTLARIVELTGARPPEGADLTLVVSGVQPIDRGGPGDLVFLDNPRYLADLAQTRATACLVAPKYAPRTPPETVALVTPHPYHALSRVLVALFPEAMRPQSMFGAQGVAPGAVVHPSARLEDDVTVDPGAVIGPGAEIGSGTIICAGAAIGPSVRVGRHCSIGAGATLQHALIGDRVIIHPGARLGQDGFGFALSPTGHLKVAQVGRVIVQDDVEIGANTTIDRGANRDTIIGEGTKIDNLVQIGHNVVIGRHCVIVSLVGLAGSCVVEDFAALGGQVGVAGHLTIGTGAQVGAQAGVMTDVPAGARYVGSPAKPARQAMRELALLARLAERSAGRAGQAIDRGEGDGQ